MKWVAISTPATPESQRPSGGPLPGLSRLKTAGAASAQQAATTTHTFRASLPRFRE